MASMVATFTATIGPSSRSSRLTVSTEICARAATVDCSQRRRLLGIEHDDLSRVFYIPNFPGGFNGDMFFFLMANIGTTIAPWMLFSSNRRWSIRE